MKKYFTASPFELAIIALSVISIISILGTPFAYALDLTIPTPPVITLPAVFTDVSASSQYYNALVYLKAQGVVGGYSDGSFKPDQKINRAEFTKIIVGAVRPSPTDYLCMSTNFQTSAGVYSDVFTDVRAATDAWYLDPICYAKMNKLVNGYPDGSFKPDQNINFAETAKIVFNGFQGSDAYVAPVDHNAPWYFTYADDLAFRHAIPTTITRFDQQITRGEMAEIVFRLKTKNTSLSSKTYAELR